MAVTVNVTAIDRNLRKTFRALYPNAPLIPKVFLNGIQKKNELTNET